MRVYAQTRIAAARIRAFLRALLLKSVGSKISDWTTSLSSVGLLTCYLVHLLTLKLGKVDCKTGVCDTVQEPILTALSVQTKDYALLAPLQNFAYKNAFDSMPSVHLKYSINVKLPVQFLLLVHPILPVVLLFVHLRLLGDLQQFVHLLVPLRMPLCVQHKLPVHLIREGS